MSPCVLFILLSSALAPLMMWGAGGAQGAALQGASTVPPAGTWTDERRLTHGLEADISPQVVVDADSQAHFLWRKATPYGEAFYQSIVEPATAEISRTAYITNHTIRGPNGGVLVGRQADVDSNGNVHVVYERGMLGILYMKFDSHGSVLADERLVGPGDNLISRLPAVAVGIDDTVHIAHVEFRFAPYDVAYDKLTNDGSEIWIDRVVTSDRSFSAATGPLIVADRYNANILLSIGTDRGSVLGHFNKFGVKDWATVEIQTQANYIVPRVSADPQGNVHLVWAEAGSLYYSRVNATGRVVVGPTVMVGSGRVTGTPSVGATSNNDVFVAWEEIIDGVRQVMFSPIDASGSLNQTAAFQLSNSSAGAYDPVLAVSPHDEPLVAWVDERDGNAELYWRFSMVPRCVLYTDPNSGPVFFHPNQTYAFRFYVQNRGYFAADYFAWEEHLPRPGWEVSLDRSDFPGIRRGETATFNVTVFIPPQAREGDNTTLEVHLGSGDGTCERVIGFPLFVQVTREVRLSGSGKQNASTGDLVAFPLYVANRGDLDERVQIRHVEGVGTNWPVQLDKTNVALAPGEATNFTAFVAVPDDAPGATPALFQLAASSTDYPTVRSLMQLQVYVEPRVQLSITASASSLSVLPGEVGRAMLNVSNRGNLPTPLSVDLRSSLGPGTPLDPVWSLQSNRLYLAAGASVLVPLDVYVPPSVLAGTTFEIPVWASNQSLAVSARLNVTLVVAAFCRISMYANPLPPLAPGEASWTTLWLYNLGNRRVSGDLSSPGLPPGWSVRFTDGPSEVTHLDLVAGGARTIGVELTAPADALAGGIDADIRYVAEGCDPANVTMSGFVTSEGRVRAAAAHDSVTGDPGGTAVYLVDLESTRNAPADVRLTTSDPDGSPSRLNAVWAVAPTGGTGDIDPLADGRLTLPPFGTVRVELRVDVPNEGSLRLIPFDVRVSGPAAAPQVLPLTLRVAWPDLEVADVAWGGRGVSAGTLLPFNVTVRNVGDRVAAPSSLVLSVDGLEVDRRLLPPLPLDGQTAVEFSWAAVAGVHRLTFRVEPNGSLEDADRANNEATVQVEVAPGEGPSRAPPWFEVAPWALLVAGAGTLAAAFALQRRR